MAKIELSNAQEIRDFQSAKKKQILDAFKREDDRTATLITKAEFDEQFNEKEYEIYSLSSIHSFRQEIMKSDIEGDKDELFKKATADLKHFMVEGNGGKRVMAFVRKKEVGE